MKTAKHSHRSSSRLQQALRTRRGRLGALALAVVLAGPLAAFGIAAALDPPSDPLSPTFGEDLDNYICTTLHESGLDCDPPADEAPSAPADIIPGGGATPDSESRTPNGGSTGAQASNNEAASAGPDAQGGSAQANPQAAKQRSNSGQQTSRPGGSSNKGTAGGGGSDAQQGGSGKSGGAGSQGSGGSTGSSGSNFSTDDGEAVRQACGPPPDAVAETDAFAHWTACAAENG